MLGRSGSLRLLPLLAATLAGALAVGWAQAASLTLHGTRASPASLRTALLRTAEVAAVPGGPGRFVAQSVTGAGVTPDPDPRAPCGAKLAEAPAFEKGRIAAFTTGTSDATIVQWVDRLEPGRAARELRVQRADAHPGCAAYRSRIPSGALQTVRFGRVVPLAAGVGDDHFAFMSRVKTPGSPWVDIGGILIRERDCLMLVVVFSTPRLSPVFVKGLAAAAAKRLDAAAGAC